MYQDAFLSLSLYWEVDTVYRVLSGHLSNMTKHPLDLAFDIITTPNFSYTACGA